MMGLEPTEQPFGYFLSPEFRYQVRFWICSHNRCLTTERVASGALYPPHTKLVPPVGLEPTMISCV